MDPNTALLIVNITLVVVTAVYVIHTGRMAAIMAKDYEIRVKPNIHVWVSELSEGPLVYDCRWTIGIENRGKNTVYVTNAKCTFVKPKKIPFLNTQQTLWKDERWGTIGDLNLNSGYYIVDVTFPEDITPDIKIILTFQYAGIDHVFKTWKMELEGKPGVPLVKKPH